MTTTLFYPIHSNKGKAFSQETFNKLASHIFEWLQGPGNIGAIHLHPCWEESSVLKRRYQGQTISTYFFFLNSFMKLYDRTGGARWKVLADNIVSNILYLQRPKGGFQHASGEFEPSYDAYNTCPIHQQLPVIALLQYAAWEHADTFLKSMVRPAVDKHWKWFNDFWWLRGNAYQKYPMKNPGWCGVTNQDLVVIAALALYAKLFGDSTRFDEFGKAALEVFLSERYYYPEIGLFERGDTVNFVERTAYYPIILFSLYAIYSHTGDGKLLDVIDNVALHIFDAMFISEDGQLHLSWGASTDPVDKSHVYGWVSTPVTMGYSEVIPYLYRTLARYPDPCKLEKLLELENTLASYVFADGTIPAAIGSKEAIMSVATSPGTGNAAFLNFLIDKLGDQIQEPEIRPTPCIHRTFGNVVWKTNNEVWAIEKEGKRVFSGYKPIMNGIVIGEDERLPYGNIEGLEMCEIKEILLEK